MSRLRLEDSLRRKRPRPGGRRAWLLLGTLCAALSVPRGAQAGSDGAEPLVVFAGASLTDVLPAVARAWQSGGGAPVRFSFDSSSRLARQIEAGAGAHLFFSADPDWMDYLAKKDLIVPASRTDLLGNRLVIVVPAKRSGLIQPTHLAREDVQRIAVAGEAVPAGRYARAALAATGLARTVTPKLVSGDNVRTALAWVALGEVDAGIVYATDARAEKKVTAVYTFPAGSHPPIVYPAAVVKAEGSSWAPAFLTFCRSPKAKALFEAAGFSLLP